MIINWLGVILGIGLILAGQILEGGHVEQLIQPTAALIVFGGTLGATLLASTMEEFTGALRSIPKLFLGGSHSLDHTVKEIVEVATAARKDGLLSLEKQIGNIKNPFFSVNLRHVVDGYDPVVLKDMMETRQGKVEEEKTAVAKVFETAGGFMPCVGIIGAVLGLIHVMSSLNDPSKLGGGIAVAFVATVYGVGAANLILLPCANKLKKMAHHDLVEMELITEGLVGIQAGLNPRVIEDRLNNILGESHSSEGDAGAKKAA